MGFGIVILFGELLNTSASFTFCGILDLPAVSFTMLQQIGFVPADDAPCQHIISFNLLYVCRSYSCLHMDCSSRLFTLSMLISFFQENMLKYINRGTFQLFIRDKNTVCVIEIIQTQQGKHFLHLNVWTTKWQILLNIISRR